MVTDPPWGVDYDAAWRANELGRRRVPRSVINDDRADWREAFALFPAMWATCFTQACVETWRSPPLNWFASCGEAANHLGEAPFCDRPWGLSKTVRAMLVRRARRGQFPLGRRARQIGRLEIFKNQDGRDDWTVHGTQKPVECMLRPIENSSQPGDAVYDPFVGSGTTIIAAQIAGRRCYAMDLDPVCCTMAIDRWQDYTGHEAVLEATGQNSEEVKNERLNRTEHGVVGAPSGPKL